MAWPPTIPAGGKVDLTPMATTHPADHNAIALALQEIVNVLGSDPAGGSADLTAYLTAAAADTAAAAAVAADAAADIAAGLLHLVSSSGDPITVTVSDSAASGTPVGIVLWFEY